MTATLGDRQTYRNEDLVLRISPKVDPSLWDDVKYEAFIDELCGDRQYQKDAIFAVMRYLAGRNYNNLIDLAKENYNDNDEIQRRYGSWANMERHLQLPGQLACSIDMATGTGKSYVLYGLAVIMLAEGLVDRVLVLCPSNTIEAGLSAKFRDLASNSDLRDQLPETTRVHTPKIINASESIITGSICIENYHAILKHTKSSIRDSLIGHGARVAVFNDEAHHVVNESGANVKRWKEFLLNPEYGFHYVVGVSGTCYVDDEYFADVVYRYSLRQAIEEQFVKKVEYVAEMPQTDNPDEKWQLIYNRHQAWKIRLKKHGIRPLTIIVTKDIKTCKLVAEELQAFLQEWEQISPDDAKIKVLPVSSAPEHQPNVALLKAVDRPSSKIEWIVSVSMLNEGWDVKNVFQIVPHEERAFNSKLLIAQVLGRGLRRPTDWRGSDPVVTVFNHDAWAARIRHLVDEILEMENRLTSSVIENSTYHFVLHNLDYTRETDTTDFAKKGEYRLLEDGYVDLPDQVEIEDVTIAFEQAVTGNHSIFKTKIEHKTYSIDEVAEDLYRHLQAIDIESKDAEKPANRTQYAMKFPLERCLEIVKASAQKARIRSGRITEENRQKILQALGPLRRKFAKRVVYKLTPKALLTVNTNQRQDVSASAADIRRGVKTVFFTPDCANTIPVEQQEFFACVTDHDGDYRAGSEEVANAYDFKTPCNMAIADAGPERRFIRILCDRNNATQIDGWLKNSPQRFYAIEYAWKKGEHPKRGDFSPDFFIKKANVIYVIEVKEDAEISDPSPENQKKFEYARDHFIRLNGWLQNEGIPITYQFNFLTPKDFNKFFIKLRQGDVIGFRSELDIVLGKPL
ncbi:MAG: DEAD/DEAH box helicase family protein [candidate division Zixibacteria bacterium]|nr:DEAD/DEAH box helicase family protein [candidate division Zixibacteria bacterium]